MLKTLNTFSSFSVPDVKEAENFYGEVLKLNTKETPQGLELQLVGGGSVFVYESAENKPADFTILNFVVDDIDAAVDTLTQQGIRMERYDMPGMEMDEKGIVRGGDAGSEPVAIAWFKDPAGNILSVLQES